MLSGQECVARNDRRKSFGANCKRNDAGKHSAARCEAMPVVRRGVGAFVLPPRAASLVALQRTDSQHRLSKLFRGSSLERPYQAVALPLVEGLHGQSIATHYSRQLEDELAIIAPHLPGKIRSVLDIGCGVGGVDVALHRHLSLLGETPEFHLLDKDGI